MWNDEFAIGPYIKHSSSVTFNLTFFFFISHHFISILRKFMQKEREKKLHTARDSERVCVWYCILRRPFRFWSFSFNLISSSGQSHKLHLTSLTRWWLVDSVLWSFTPHILSWWWVCVFFFSIWIFVCTVHDHRLFVSFQKPLHKVGLCPHKQYDHVSSTCHMFCFFLTLCSGKILGFVCTSI